MSRSEPSPQVSGDACCQDDSRTVVPQAFDEALPEPGRESGRQSTLQDCTYIDASTAELVGWSPTNDDLFVEVGGVLRQALSGAIARAD